MKRYAKDRQGSKSKTKRAPKVPVEQIRRAIREADELAAMARTRGAAR